MADGNHGSVGPYSLVVNESTGMGTQLAGWGYTF